MSDDSCLKEIPESEITQTIEDPVKTQSSIWEIIRAAKEEVLILVSSAKAFARQENAGSVEMLKDLFLKSKDLKIRILTPRSDHVEEVRSEIEDEYPNFEIKYIQEFSQTKISIVVVDRKRSLVIEMRNDDAVTSLDAMGQTTYSTRVLTVLSYVSIFESYWTLSQMYEESRNELASTKEYLSKVLKEIDNKGK